jgi:hypothetical protein
VSRTATSLDPLETNGHRLSASPSASSYRPEAGPIPFRHSGWQHDRTRVRRALRDAQVPASRVEAFDRCGSDAYLVESDTEPGKCWISACYCHDRFCVPCNVARSHRLAATLADLVRPKDVRFITLTLKADGRSLSDRLSHLATSFRRLKRTADWRRRVTAGAWFLEVKFNLTTRSWHPHLHILATGLYYPQADLSRAWLAATGDSRIVDIRKVRRASEVASYVTKYVSKPLDAPAYHDHDALVEAILALKGQRLCGSLGSWRGKLLTGDVPDNPSHHVVSLQVLLLAAQNRDPLTLDVLMQLKQKRTITLTPAELATLARSPPFGDSYSVSTVTPTAQPADSVLNPDWLSSLPVW